MSAQLKPEAPLELDTRIQPLQAMPQVHLRPMELSDIERIVALENAAYAFPWTAQNMLDSLNSGYQCFCAATHAQIVAYFIAMDVIDEVHLLNITVGPAFHGLGLGRWMLEQVTKRARAQHAASVWLEVRPSNSVALALYDSVGFSCIGRRPNYYPALGGLREDALLMKLVLREAEPQ